MMVAAGRGVNPMPAARECSNHAEEPMPRHSLYALLLLAALPLAAAAEEDLRVQITADIPSVTVTHDGEPVTIRREQFPDATIEPPYDRTARACPPFCVQPMSLHPAVETIGEIEMLRYLEQASASDQVLVIDSRTPDWVARGTIPGSVNIPWTELDLEKASPDDMAALLQFDFGVVRHGELWDFSNAKTLVLYCNGLWCGQSPTNIRNLLTIGYPAEKLKWYRGGMQAWMQLGLTTVGDDDS